MNPESSLEKTRAQRSPSEEKCREIRAELLAWLPRASRDAHGASSSPTATFSPTEAEEWVDRIFAIDSDGSVTVKNVVMFESVLRETKGAPPYVKTIKGSLRLSLIQLDSLDWLKGITIHGDLYLPLHKEITRIPEGITIDGKIIVSERTNEALRADVKKKYATHVRDIRTKER